MDNAFKTLTCMQQRRDVDMFFYAIMFDVMIVYSVILSAFITVISTCILRASNVVHRSTLNDSV